MATKKTRLSAAVPSPKKSNPNAFEVDMSKDTKSQTLAKLITGSVLSGATLKQFSGAGEDLAVADLVLEMKKAGNEAVAGDLGRIERMLANQLLTLDMLFNNLAQRSGRQESFKGIEVLMRLALKAQAQSRATAETLSIIKNPMPYIRQANIAGGHQQINNSVQADQHARTHAHAGNFQTEPNKLLEEDHGQRLDIGAQATTGRDGQTVAAMGQVHRAKDAWG